MLDRYITITKDDQAELEIKKSRFICALHRIDTEEEAKALIQAYKKKHPKANHHCSAFILGKKAEIKRSSDDGEPSGTAGAPILDVLVQNQVVNVLAVVIRYFGGTKLGAGGLIRAYSSATSHALQQIGRVEVRQERQLVLTIDYHQVDKLTHYLETIDQPIVATEYADTVKITLCTSKQESLIAAITDFLNGQLHIEIKDIVEASYPLQDNS
ncbi:YigZ family protein [uncultured Enterococcus sp.]|uniref:YigZ family protein n=1 Tax=uncultured Enterococcus sp. TaxID=167972 RepID=UPI0025DB4F3E|nr:YigZ family protein [uncultured Enterococcus sp.]